MVPFDNLFNLEKTIENTNDTLSASVGIKGAKFEYEQYLQNNSAWNVAASLGRNGATLESNYETDTSHLNLRATYRGGNHYSAGVEYNQLLDDTVNLGVSAIATQKELKAILGVTYNNLDLSGYVANNYKEGLSVGVSGKITFGL